jgi:hypothetical protein
MVDWLLNIKVLNLPFSSPMLQSMRKGNGQPLRSIRLDELSAASVNGLLEARAGRKHEGAGRNDAWQVPSQRQNVAGEKVGK